MVMVVILGWRRVSFLFVDCDAVDGGPLGEFFLGDLGITDFDAIVG